MLLTYVDISGSRGYLEFVFKKDIEEELITKENYYKLKDSIYTTSSKSMEEEIIYKAIDNEASDIHFEPLELYVNIRYRINGMLTLVNKISHSDYKQIISKVKNDSKLDFTEKRKPMDGKIIIHYKSRKYDLRISTIPVIYGEKLVIRILYCDSFSYSLDTLGFNEYEIQTIRKINSLSSGLILICGPTGSGKSTTLYTMLKELDASHVNITTLEDPVEVNLPGINQVALNKNYELNFENGLRSILRQDPDIIMVGEIRDDETAKIAVNAAITGHKVYSTIHAKSPRQVIMRLENMGVKRYLIKEALVGVISQRLVKILCSKCKVKDIVNSDNENTYYKKSGCKHCKECGYDRRKVISTVCYLGDSALYSLDSLDSDNKILTNSTMKRDLTLLLKKGEISYNDYIRFKEGEMLDG